MLVKNETSLSSPTCKEEAAFSHSYDDGSRASSSSKSSQGDIQIMNTFHDDCEMFDTTNGICHETNTAEQESEMLSNKECLYEFLALPDAMASQQCFPRGCSVLYRGTRRDDSHTSTTVIGTVQEVGINMHVEASRETLYKVSPHGLAESMSATATVAEDDLAFAPDCPVLVQGLPDATSTEWTQAHVLGSYNEIETGLVYSVRLPTTMGGTTPLYHGIVKKNISFRSIVTPPLPTTTSNTTSNDSHHSMSPTKRWIQWQDENQNKRLRGELTEDRRQESGKEVLEVGTKATTFDCNIIETVFETQSGRNKDIEDFKQTTDLDAPTSMHDDYSVLSEGEIVEYTPIKTQEKITSPPGSADQFKLKPAVPKPMELPTTLRRSVTPSSFSDSATSKCVDSSNENGSELPPPRSLTSGFKAVSFAEQLTGTKKTKISTNDSCNRNPSDRQSENESKSRQRHWTGLCSARKLLVKLRLPYPYVRPSFAKNKLVGHGGCIRNQLCREFKCTIAIAGTAMNPGKYRAAYKGDEELCVFVYGDNLDRLVACREALETILVESVPEDHRGYLLMKLAECNDRTNHDQNAPADVFKHCRDTAFHEYRSYRNGLARIRPPFQHRAGDFKYVWSAMAICAHSLTREALGREIPQLFYHYPLCDICLVEPGSYSPGLDRSPPRHICIWGPCYDQVAQCLSEVNRINS